MARLPPFEVPVVNPELDRLVRELDQRLDRDFLAELRPALERLPAIRPPPPEHER